MALIPIPIRRRLRDSGFSEAQTNALDEATEATAEAAREGLAQESRVNDQFGELRSEMQQLRSEMQQLRAEMQQLRSEMNAIKWWLFGALSMTMLAATAAIIAAIAVWG